MPMALCDKLSDDSFAGKIPSFTGVIAFGATLRECEEELQSTLEDWILIALKEKQNLPILSGINLNKRVNYEPVSSL